MSTNTKKKKHNPTSGVRKGYNYQTLCAAELCYKLLSQPKAYQSIIVEYQNDDQNHNFKFNDIVLIKKDPKKFGYQCKYSGKTKTWKKTEFSKLIKTLSRSYNSPDCNEFSTLYLQTNRALVEEYKSKYDPKTQQFNDLELDGVPEEFWNKVKFIFENSSLKEKEKSVKQLFYKLKCTKDGVNSLLLNLKKEEEKEHTVEINVEELKKWLEYYDPRTLKQDFEIPQDFQYFDPDIHEKLITELLESSCSTKVIIGSPGVGKSTYIAKLYEDLKNKKVCSIKHHYYINNSDNDLYDRLDCDRIIEGFKANLTQDYEHLLGERANQNLENISCEVLIDELSKNLQNDSTFIIIIDGLDHCSKHGKSEGLKSFLEKIYFPKMNVRYIFATQPQILDDLSIIQRYDTIKMNGLSENAIYSIINQNSIKLLFPEDQSEKNKILQELFMRCEGNVLYLRYILGYLKNNADEKIHIESLNKLLENFPLYEGDLNKYYNLIWKENTDIIKRILATATVFWHFQCFYTREQLIRCISNSNTEIWLNFQKFEHLLKYHKNHTIFFHSSFPEFICNLKDYKDNIFNVKKNILKWLEGTNLQEDQYIKWFLIDQLKYSISDEIDLSIINDIKEWFIKAILCGRNIRCIKMLMCFYKKILTKHKLLVLNKEHPELVKQYKGLEREESQFDTLDRIETRVHFVPLIKNLGMSCKDFSKLDFDLTNNIWMIYDKYIETILSINPEALSAIVLRDLSYYALERVVRFARKNNRFKEIDDDVYCIISEKIESIRSTIGKSNNFLQYYNSLINITAYYDQFSIKDTIYPLIKFPEVGSGLTSSYRLIDEYVNSLLQLGRKDSVFELIDVAKTGYEQETILAMCIIDDFKYNTKIFLDRINSLKNRTYIEEVYLLLHTGKCENKDFSSSFKRLHTRESFIEYNVSKWDFSPGIFSIPDDFFIIILQLWNNKHLYPMSASYGIVPDAQYDFLIDIAKLVIEAIKIRQIIDYCKVLSILNNFIDNVENIYKETFPEEQRESQLFEMDYEKFQTSANKESWKAKREKKEMEDQVKWDTRREAAKNHCSQIFIYIILFKMCLNQAITIQEKEHEYIDNIMNTQSLIAIVDLQSILRKEILNTSILKKIVEERSRKYKEQDKKIEQCRNFSLKLSSKDPEKYILLADLSMKIDNNKDDAITLLRNAMNELIK